RGFALARLTAAILALVAHPELREQPCEDRPMDGLGGSATAVLRAARPFCVARVLLVLRTGRARELADEIHPFAHPQKVQELSLAQPTERARGEPALLGLEVFPEVQQGHQIAERIGEAG